jgi:hypothetical protein
MAEEWGEYWETMLRETGPCLTRAVDETLETELGDGFAGRQREERGDGEWKREA